jgi:hypothetical protein
MFKSVSYINPQLLQEIWKKHGSLIVVNFVYPTSTLSRRALDHMGVLAQKYVGSKVLFINSELKETEGEVFIDDYKFNRLPAILFFSKGKEIYRMNSWRKIQAELESKVKELSSEQ